MNKESVYLDTSIPSAYYDTRAEERLKATRKFWKEILPKYEVFVSNITLDELENTKEESLRRNLLNLIDSFKIIKSNKEIEILANEYIKKNIIPEKYFIDALHIAIASFYSINFLISWNFEYIVKVKTRRIVKLVNILSGFREIEIVSPREL